MEQPQQTPQTQLHFKPVTEGLGFHPFSDGLPYAPLSKNLQNPAQSNFKAASKKPDEILSSLSIGAEPLRPQQKGLPKKPSFQLPIQLQPPQVPLNPLAKKLQNSISYNFIYIFKRILAYSLDTLLNATAFATILSTMVWTQNFKWDILLNSNVLVAGILFFTFFHWLLMTTQEVLFKTTLGKNAFQLYFEAPAWGLLARACLFPLNLFLGGLGLFVAVLDDQKRCWHDRFFNIQPLQRV